MINMGTDYAYVQPTKMIPNTTDTLIVQSASLNSGYSNGEVIPLIQHGKHLDFMMRPKSSVVLMTNDEQVSITPPGYRLPASTNGPMYLPPPPTYLPPYPSGPGPERPKVDPDNSFGMGPGGVPPGPGMGPGFGFNPDWMTNDRMKPPFMPPGRPSRTTVSPDSKPKNAASAVSPAAAVFVQLISAYFAYFKER
ncbi:uncharacterized protein [Bemisia tabaci]